MYNLTEIWTDLGEEFVLAENQDKLKKVLKSLVDTINYDVEHMHLRPYSHNVISSALRYISGAGSQEMAFWVMDQMRAIESIYKIQRPEPHPKATESHGERRSR